MSDMDYEVAHGIAQIENAKLRAEIDRLRALLEECRPYVANASHWDVALIASIDAALDTPHRALEGK